jgi:hypothetical protein
MSSLTEYTVMFRTDAESADLEIAAASPQGALAEARAIAADSDRLAELEFDPYCEVAPVNEIVVESPDGDQAAVWRDDELRLRLAAADLLAAAEKAVAALDIVPRFRVPGLAMDSYAIAAECRQAIAKATAPQPSLTPRRRPSCPCIT